MIESRYLLIVNIKEVIRGDVFLICMIQLVLLFDNLFVLPGS